MKKTLPLLITSMLLTSQTYANFMEFGFNEASNYGSIKISVTGDCQFEKTYTINDLAVKNYTPTQKLGGGNKATYSLITDLGNFQFHFSAANSKDKISFIWNEKLAKITASTTEKTLLNDVLTELPEADTVHSYPDYTRPNGNPQNTNATFHNIYKKLASDANFDGSCNGGTSFKNRFGSNLQPLVNSPSFKLKAKANYSAAINTKTMLLTTTASMNTVFGGPLKQSSSKCTTNSALTLTADNYSYSCTAAAPVILTVTISVNAKETFDLINAG